MNRVGKAFMRCLRRAARSSVVGRFAAQMTLTLCAACQTSPSGSDPKVTSNASGAASNVGRVTTGAATTLAVSHNDTPSVTGDVTPEWAVGNWHASGTATTARLQLPNNQGVQLAWLKDKGDQYAGQLELTLTLAPNGDVTAELVGALGTLRASGAWPKAGPLHLELRPTEEANDVFHGTLTVTWDAQKKQGSATLRAASGDGHWLRTANLEVTRPS
jgi:hypothetical protein